jgi:hypothetical protein
MLDKRTFGSTPAAVYLADRLNELNDSQQTHRISSYINNTKKVINEAVDMHVNHGMSTRLLYFIANKIACDVSKTADDMIKGVHGITYDQTSCNLMANVLRGHVKSIKRRLEDVVHIHRHQKRAKIANVSKPVVNNKSTVLGKTEFVPLTITIANIPDMTNECTLAAKSIKRLRRVGVDQNLIGKFYKR